MYQAFVEKYATVTLISLLGLTSLIVGLSALGAYLAYRQTARSRFRAIPLVRAMRDCLPLAMVPAAACAITLFVLSPKGGLVGLPFGLAVALLSYALIYLPNVSDVVLRGYAGLMVFGALGLFGQLHQTLMPSLYAVLAVLPLVLLKVFNRYEHKRFVVMYWD